MNAEKVKVLARKNLEHLIEANILGRLKQNEYVLYKVDALSLLTYNRFSLAFKIIFLQMIDKCYEYGEEIYLEHIKAFSYGTFIEPHSKNKIGKEKFLEDYINLYEKIKEVGFDPEKSVLPLSSRNHIKNGSHRLAASIFTNKEVYFIKTENIGPVFNYKYFYNRNVRPEFLDAAAVTFSEFSRNTHLALAIHDGLHHEKELEEIFAQLVYKKKILLTKNGFANLNGMFTKATLDDTWQFELDFQSNFSRDSNTVYAYQFQADESELAIIKQKLAHKNIRNSHQIIILNIHDDVINFSRLFFNEHALHFINHAQIHHKAKYLDKIDSLKSALIAEGLDLNDFLVSADFIPELYGLKVTEKVPFISSIHKADWSKYNGIKNDNNDIKYYGLEQKSLVYDPRNHFIYFGVKFLSFENTVKFKKNRLSEIDLEDLKLLELLPPDKRKFVKIERFKQKILYSYYFIINKTEKTVGNLLRRIGIYSIINKYYTDLKTKLK